MYQVVNPRRLLRLRRRAPGRRVARNVVLLGLVSFFTDISSEMVATILPLYLFYTLGFTPLQFGFVDGLQQGAAALVRVAGGFAADRTRRHKEVAWVGYANAKRQAHPVQNACSQTRADRPRRRYPA